MIESMGPQPGVMWIDADEQRVRAKQLEMLSIDERSAVQWVTTMRELVDRKLADEEFTIERMAKLHAWEKQRKREQHNLHYKYDPRRRNPKLVERDTRRQLEKLRQGLERASLRLAPYVAQAAVEATKEPSATVTPPQEIQRQPAAPIRKPVRSLDGIAPHVIAMISDDTGISELQYATDDDIRRAYDPESAHLYVDMLNGTSTN